MARCGNTVQGKYNKESFREYLVDILSTLKLGDIVIMHNLSVHKNSFVTYKFNGREIDIKCIPRYMRDLNPIENMWAKLKEIVQKNQAVNRR